MEGLSFIESYILLVDLEWPKVGISTLKLFMVQYDIDILLTMIF